MRDIDSMSRGECLGPETGATQYHAQLGLPDKGCAIKGLVVYNSWDLEPLDLLNGLALGCYQPSLEVLIVLYRQAHTKCELNQENNKFYIKVLQSLN